MYNFNSLFEFLFKNETNILSLSFKIFTLIELFTILKIRMIKYLKHMFICERDL